MSRAMDVKVCVLICVTLWTLGQGYNLCPDVCYCRRDPPPVLQISCMYYNFNSAPRLDPEVGVLEFTKSANLTLIQNEAFTALHNLSALRIKSLTSFNVQARAFSGLTSLRHLVLDAPTSSELPQPVFSPLTSLTTLTLNLRLSIIPSLAICQIPDLRYLELQFGQLTENITFGGCFLGGARSITTLVITSNQSINQLTNSAFVNLRNSPLSDLNLKNSGIKTIEVGVFKPLKMLTTLNLRLNNIKTLPGDIFLANTRLQSLDLLDTGLKDFPCAQMRTLRHLTSLDVSDNRFKHVQFCDVYSNLTRLTSVNLDLIKIPVINNSTFRHVAKLQRLTLAVNGDIYPGALSVVPKLRELQISGYQGARNFTEIFSSLRDTSLTQLWMRDITELQEVRNNTLEMLTLLNITSFYLTHGHIKVIQSGAFYHLQQVKYLNLSENEITSLKTGTFNTLTKLEVLNLEDNKLNDLDLVKWGVSKTLTEINVNSNDGIKLVQRTFSTYENLVIVKMARCGLKQLDRLAWTYPSNILSLDLKQNNFKKLTGKEFKDLTNLTHLDLSNQATKMTFGPRYPESNPFEYQIQLRVLKIVGAELDRDCPFLSDMFANHPTLEELWIQQNSLTYLPLRMFTNTSGLKILGLQSNRIDSWEPEVFDPMGDSLQYLYLENNKVAYINETSFIYLRVLLQVDLSHNPLICVCELVWFKAWLRQAEINLSYFGDKERYKCYGPVKWQDRKMLDFDLTVDDCIDKTALIISLSVSGSLVLLIIISVTAYKYQVYIIYLIYWLKRRGQRLLEDTDDEEYQFDAYVSYSTEDRNWIRFKLLKEMEEKRGFYLAVHDRDFVPGVPIADNIEKHMNASRKIIVVLSQNYPAEGWRLEEAYMAHQRCLGEDRNSLIIIKLGDVPQHSMTSFLRTLVTTHAPLPWPIKEEERKRFWKMLTSELKHDVKTTSDDSTVLRSLSGCVTDVLNTPANADDVTSTSREEVNREDISLIDPLDSNLTDNL